MTEYSTRQELFNDIESRRVSMAISVPKFSKTAGFSHVAWYHYMHGNRKFTWDTLFKAAGAVGINIAIRRTPE